MTTWLKVFLKEKPHLQLVRVLGVDLFEDYQPIGLPIPEFICHYDWLRSTKNQIVGVRLCPFPEDPKTASAFTRLEEKCHMLSYAFADPEMRYIAIMFYPSTKIDPSISEDQDFGDIGIYASPEGDLALGIEAASPYDKQFDLILDAPPFVTDGDFRKESYVTV